MTMKHLPDGGVVVTLNDGMDWTPLDVFTWVAYRERRIPCGDNENAQFPRAEWSRDWVHWPVGNLAAALGEMATEVLCLHTEGSYDEEQADNSRAWARKVMARNGEDARGLAKALAVDLERSRLAEMDYKNAKEEVHVALRAGRLQVWARRAHGQHKSNRNADHEPLGAGVFTLLPREVDEGAWVGTPSGDDGPWWDEARFKPDDVLALWPAGEGIAALASVPAPCPKIETITPATAASGRTMTTLEARPRNKPRPTPNEYTEANLRGWFVLRVRTRRAGAVPPTEVEDLKDARAHFGHFPRDRFRDIRREKTPLEWRRPGPRRPRD